MRGLRRVTGRTLVAIPAALAGAAGACAFPSPQLLDVAPAAADAADGGPLEPEASTDAATEEAGPDCDRDRDEALSRACGGDDCDDDDPAYHPGAPFSTTAPAAGKDWDYDCSDAEEKPPTDFSCVNFGTLDCEGESGFTEDAACGAEAKFETCHLSNELCKGEPTTKAMPCR